MGIRRARRARRRRPMPWGESSQPDGRLMANTWQGRFPFENLAEDGYEGTSPVDAFPAERLRPLRHDRQCLGVDGLALSLPQRRRRQTVLLPARRRRSTQQPARGEGRLASLRAQLLPALPARGAAGRSRRYLDLPHRLSLRHARRRTEFIRNGRRHDCASTTAPPRWHWRILPAIADIVRSPREFTRETLAGVVTALALIPEVISFSFISGVDPKVALIASIVLGLVMSVLGGRPAW